MTASSVSIISRLILEFKRVFQFFLCIFITASGRPVSIETHSWTHKRGSIAFGAGVVVLLVLSIYTVAEGTKEAARSSRPMRGDAEGSTPAGSEPELDRFR